MHQAQNWNQIPYLCKRDLNTALQGVSDPALHESLFVQRHCPDVVLVPRLHDSSGSMETGYPAHRVLLICRSAFFARLFSEPWCNLTTLRSAHHDNAARSLFCGVLNPRPAPASSSAFPPRVPLHLGDDVTLLGLEAVLEYIYCSPTLELTLSTVTQIHAAACFLQVCGSFTTKTVKDA